MGSIRRLEANGRLFFDFRYQGKRYREYTSLPDTPRNRAKLKKLMASIDAEIRDGTFEYVQHFPNSRMAGKFETGHSADPNSNPATVVVSAPAPTSHSANAVSVPEIGRPAAAMPAMTPPMARPTFAAFSETWMSECEVTWRRSYRKTVSDIVRLHLLPRFGERDVGSIQREELLALRAELAKVPGRRKKALSPRRINAIMNVVGLILKEASDRYKFICPVYNIKPLKLPRSDVHPFSLEEVQLILDSVRADYREYFTVRFFTGMRTGEVDGLKWEYVDFDRRVIMIRETIVAGEIEDDAKTLQSIRDIQMNQVVFDALKRQHAVTGHFGKFVFRNREGNPLDHNNVTKRVWYPLLRYLDLKPRRPYQTRHTAATLWLASGENPEWIARQMGHASTEMLFTVYSRFVPNLTRKDGSAFERLLARTIAAPQPGKEADAVSTKSEMETSDE